MHGGSICSATVPNAIHHASFWPIWPLHNLYDVQAAPQPGMWPTSACKTLYTCENALWLYALIDYVAQPRKRDSPVPMGLPNVKADPTPMAQCGQGAPYCGSPHSEDNSDLQDLHAAPSAYRRIHQLNRHWMKLLLWRGLKLLLVQSSHAQWQWQCDTYCSKSAT